LRGAGAAAARSQAALPARARARARAPSETPARSPTFLARRAKPSPNPHPNPPTRLQEAKIALVRLFQRFEFELSPGQVPLKLRQGITLSPRDGVWVTPVERGAPPAPAPAAPMAA
jgi:hypothetical protein